jgi:predicted kinase
MTSSKVIFDNPMPHVIPEGANATPLEVVGATASDKLIIIMVGLPGSGKTFVAKRICRYITFFLDIPTQIFNVGDYRRELCGVQMPASFYDPKNETAKAERNKACDAALDDMIEYMKKDGVRLAVYDATNNNVENRAKLLKRISEEGLGCKRMFVECLVDDQAMLDENFKNVKLSTPDYHGVDEKQAMKDFLERRQNYASVYESVKDEEGSYVRIINYKKFEISGVRGYIRLRVSNHGCFDLKSKLSLFFFV